MREERTGVRYFGLSELANAYGIKSEQKSDSEKLTKAREKFVSKHLCRACKEPMIYVTGTSTMVCNNPKCKGIKNVRKDKEGNDIVTYLPSYDLLDEKGMSIATSLFE